MQWTTHPPTTDLELGQAGILLGHLKGEALDHRLLHPPHRLQARILQGLGQVGKLGVRLLAICHHHLNASHRLQAHILQQDPQSEGCG